MAIVTGSSAGIGAAICKDLCQHNVLVVGLARRLEKLEQLKKVILDEKPDAIFQPFKCDLTSEGDIEAAFDYVQKNFGGVDILVNNAGVAEYGCLLEDTDLDRLKKVIDTNLTAVVSCTKKAYNSMVERDVPGYIINISSIRGHTVTAFPGVKPIMNVYAPTKFALTAFNQVIGNELKYLQKTKIRTSNISPGAVRTEIYEVGGLDLNTKAFGQDMSFLEPGDVSEMVINLLKTNPRVQVQDVIIRPVNQL